MCQIQAGFVWSTSDRPVLRRACSLRCLHCPSLQPFSLGTGGSQGPDHTLLWTEGFGSCPVASVSRHRLRRQQATAVMCCLCPCWVWDEPPGSGCLPKTTQSPCESSLAQGPRHSLSLPTCCGTRMQRPLAHDS